MLIQVKGGRAAKPTEEDKDRLGAVAERHHAEKVLLGDVEEGNGCEVLRLAVARRAAPGLGRGH